MANRLKSFVERRLAELKTNAFEAAREGGLERGFINDILQGKKSSVRGNNVLKLANALNVSVADLVEETSEGGLLPEVKDWIEKNPNTMRDEKFLNMEEIRDRYPKAKLRSAVAIYNLLKQSDGDTLIEPRPTSFIQENEFTRDTRIDYAVVIYDNFMSPEFNPGELALIDFSYPPVEGLNYMFKTDSGDFSTKICIAKLIGYDDEFWNVRHWKPERDLALPRSIWTSCHRVVGKIAR